METVGASRVFAETSDTVLLIGLEVAFEPVPLGWILVIAFPCENMRGHAVEEPTVVRDHHSAAREAKQCVFKRFKSFDIKIVGRFVEQLQNISVQMEPTLNKLSASAKELQAVAQIGRAHV